MRDWFKKNEPLSAMLLILLCGGVLGGCVTKQYYSPSVVQAAGPQGLPRFEHVYTEDPKDESTYGRLRFAVYHDRHTGAELVCATTVGVRDESASCWLSGRSW